MSFVIIRDRVVSKMKRKKYNLYKSNAPRWLAAGRG